MAIISSLVFPSVYVEAGSEDVLDLRQCFHPGLTISPALLVLLVSLGQLLHSLGYSLLTVLLDDFSELALEVVDESRAFILEIVDEFAELFDGSRELGLEIGCFRFVFEVILELLIDLLDLSLLHWYLIISILKSLQFQPSPRTISKCYSCVYLHVQALVFNFRM